MRVLLYAPVDLNLIDGSAIWCASVAQMLVQDEQIHVHILLNAALERTVNTQALTAHPRIHLLDSWQPEAAPLLRTSGEKLGSRLKPEQAFERITRLHAAEPFNLFVLRGGPICRLVAEAPPLAARSWFYLTEHGADAETMAAVARSNGRIACQTPLLQEYLEGVLGTGAGRYVPLPPMVPRLLCDAPRTTRRGRKLCYVGKFEADYMIEELLAAFAELRAHFADAELVIAGDKFHDPQRTGEFERRVRAALRNTPGVDWRGAMPRDAVGQLMTECDLGCCWRSARYDQSRELSTKALEYAAAGLPVLLNPAGINRLVFGADYPLYVDSPASFREHVEAAFEDEEAYRQAAERAFATCRDYTFGAVNATLQPHLDAYRPSARTKHVANRPTRLLFVGHDFKFCQEITEHFESRPDCLVRVDHWRNHTQHDELRSAQLLRWADVIWCEWCLGNAVWCSARVRPEQRLIVRLHRQEIATDYPRAVMWGNVNDLIFIAPHVRDALAEQLGVDTLPVPQLIFNVVDCARFERAQSPEAAFRLGMLGYCPKLKNPRLAVEILQRLGARDERWKLVLTGHPPQHYAWLWGRREERAYYEEFEAFIAANDLERHIIRQEWTDDPAAWFADVGFILSTSDLEGSHQTIAEGMAAGCIPVVRRWPGAAEMYPNSLLFETADEAAELIHGCTDRERRAQLAAAGRREARARFDIQVILPQLQQIVAGDRKAPSPRDLRNTVNVTS